MDIVVVIMAGGYGTRFRPLSTEERPKQFLTLAGGRSLLQQSHDNVAGIVPPERVLVLTNARHTGLVAEQLPDIPAGNIIGEPCKRDTAAAVTLAALVCRKRFGNPVMAVITADHHIAPAGVFHETLLSAARAAASGDALYTFGIAPTRPATAYGYLELGRTILTDGGIAHHRVRRFHEKPDAATAAGYLRKGGYAWNSGMFVWTVDAILDRLARHLPGHVDRISVALDLNGVHGLGNAFESLEPVSIDYGVMERETDIRCVDARFEWSDLGGWEALGEFLPADGAGNHVRGRAVTLDASDNIVYCEDGDETVTLIGVRDMVIVRAGARSLVVPKDRLDDLKRLAESEEDGPAA